MQIFWSLVLTLALSAISTADPLTSTPELKAFTQIQTERVVIGSVADVFTRYDHGEPTTVIHILEFSTDLPLQKPRLLEVRLCGDQSGKLQSAVHTNITLVYNRASQTRLTGCLRLISSNPWRDSSNWETSSPHPVP